MIVLQYIIKPGLDILVKIKSDKLHIGFEKAKTRYSHSTLRKLQIEFEFENPISPATLE